MLEPRVARVFPRRKRGENGEVERARNGITLSHQDLTALFHLRQSDAAQQLGISLTALKSACRHVGIMKWPYVRPTLPAVSASESEADHNVSSIAGTNAPHCPLPGLVEANSESSKRRSPLTSIDDSQPQSMHEQRSSCYVHAQEHHYSYEEILGLFPWCNRLRSEPQFAQLFIEALELVGNR
eukprot:756411-Hanusia_phi.AAC.2